MMTLDLGAGKSPLHGAGVHLITYRCFILNYLISRKEKDGQFLTDITLQRDISHGSKNWGNPYLYQHCPSLPSCCCDSTFRREDLLGLQLQVHHWEASVQELRQKPKQRPCRNNSHRLALSSLLSCFSFTSQNHVAGGQGGHSTAHSGLDPPLFISNQGNTPRDMPSLMEAVLQ